MDESNKIEGKKTNRNVIHKLFNGRTNENPYIAYIDTLIVTLCVCTVHVYSGNIDCEWIVEPAV